MKFAEFAQPACMKLLRSYPSFVVEFEDALPQDAQPVRHHADEQDHIVAGVGKVECVLE